MLSIAAAQILFALSLALFAASRDEWKLPPRLLLPVAAFGLWTVLSLAFSDLPRAGLSQIRKLVLFAIVALIFSVYGHIRQIKLGFMGTIATASFAACVGVAQFVADYLRFQREGVAIYKGYVTHQISGFMSHWLTFGAELMLASILLVTLMLFLPRSEFNPWWGLAALPLTTAIILSFTRGIWIATFAGVGYLLARCKRRWLLVAFPVALAVVALLAPSWLQDRVRSIGNAKSDSSNRARIVMLRTGIEIIKRHPVFGVGPERVGPLFLSYKPPSLELPEAWYGHLHNNYLQIAAERGLPCLAILLWFFFEILRQSVRLTRSSSDQTRAMGHLILAATIALMTAGLFEYNFGDSEVLMTYLFIVAAANAWAQLDVQSLMQNLQ